LSVSHSVLSVSQRASPPGGRTHRTPVGAGERAGVTVRGARRRGLGAPGLDDRDRLARGARAAAARAKARRILDAFEVQAERRDARVIAEHLDQILDREQVWLPTVNR
jgi:hypothetical protein